MASAQPYSVAYPSICIRHCHNSIPLSGLNLGNSTPFAEIDSVILTHNSRHKLYHRRLFTGRCRCITQSITCRRCSCSRPCHFVVASWHRSFTLVACAIDRFTRRRCFEQSTEYLRVSVLASHTQSQYAAHLACTHNCTSVSVTLTANSAAHNDVQIDGLHTTFSLLQLATQQSNQQHTLLLLLLLFDNTIEAFFL